MKVSASVLCSALAALYLAAHLPSLAPSLEDIDSINFALGLREFDVAKHQPHPPGYPVYIALGRTSLSAIHAIAPSVPQVRAEALALAIWSAIFGAVAVAGAFLLFRTLERPPPNHRAVRLKPDTTSRGVRLQADRDAAVWSAALLGVVPLFWISGLRPMSDMVGLALALVAQ